MDGERRLQLHMVLKYIHISASCVWLGAGLCVLVLLFLDNRAANGDELYAYNHGIRYIDEYLIKPAASVTFVSGVLICFLLNLGLFSCRWIVTKWSVSVVAIVFGALCLGPWLKNLSLIAGIERFAAFDDANYYHNYHNGVIFGFMQTAVLLLLVLISVVKPCGGSTRNCVLCREKVTTGQKPIVPSHAPLVKKGVRKTPCGNCAG